MRTLYRDRLRLAGCLVGTASAVGAVLRCVLYARFHEGPFSAVALIGAVAAGVVYDLLTDLVALSPLWIGLAFFRWRWLALPWARASMVWIAFTALSFKAVVEFFFFEEFNARFNHIALDYVLAPREVFGNINESYNVPLYVALSALAGALLALPTLRALSTATFDQLPWRGRWRAAIAVVSGSAVATLLLVLLPATISQSRIDSEIAQNGLDQLVRAYVTSELDYPLYYRTLPTPEARTRAARVLGFPEPDAIALAADEADFELQKDLASAHGIPRETANAVAGPGGLARLDVVVVIEESFGSEFVGVLPGDAVEKCTPAFDRWSKEGLLLANLTATGNRTVRGLESVLASFVPLPGDAILKREKSEDIATIARVLRAQGYRTTFLYGGFGVFDDMKPFMTRNGWDEFIEEPDYPPDSFKTIWGVADEYIFDALLARQQAAHAKGEPLFATLMSVSNHKPYRFPDGRVEWPPDKRSRRGAVMYSDWCIGRYLDQAKAAGLLEHTIVLIVGDHGARVYGSEEIPTPSYRIPALFLTPDARWKGRRVQRVCSQIDLAPTVLDLAGISCRAPFLGTSVLALPDDGGRAFVSHNRDVGLLTDRTLVVLGLQKQVWFYGRSDRDSDVFHSIDEAHATAEMRDLEHDLTAVFQVAYELYQARRYRLSDATASR